MLPHHIFLCEKTAFRKFFFLNCHYCIFTVNLACVTYLERILHSINIFAQWSFWLFWLSCRWGLSPFLSGLFARKQLKHWSIIVQELIKLCFFWEKVFPIYNALTFPLIIQIPFHFIFMVADIKWLSLHTLCALYVHFSYNHSIQKSTQVDMT